VALAAVISWWALHASSPKFGIALVACLVGGIWIVAYVNVFNFMDGMNGLAGLAAAIAGITFALIGFHQHHLTFAIGGAALAGAALGFLPWNFPNARVFLGDVGSYLLGAWTVLLMLLGWKAHLPWECLMGPVALFTADTGWTLAGRIVRGEDWTASHKQHVYQRLHQGGWSHTQTTLFLGILISVCAALGSLSLTHSLGSRVLGDGLIVLLLAAYLSSPRFLAQVKRSTS
jgi:UDP-N-acetylmuramyl pentapeptide phosphotransferase/UDP-N-acetylglucosamine-1-phosphate transferase